MTNCTYNGRQHSRHALGRGLSFLMALGLATALTGCPAPQEPEWELWLRFAHLSDAHLCDEESPARAVGLDRVIPESWRPQEAYTAQVLDATLRAVNQYHQNYPLAFLIHTGDAVDLSQFNELRWFIDIFDAQMVDPDSGAKEGALLPLDPAENPHLPFNPTGLDPAIPWYSVFGNHDGLAVGNFGIDASAADPGAWVAPLWPIAANIIGLYQFEDRPQFLWPLDDRSPSVLLAGDPPQDSETLQIRLENIPAGPIPPDPGRAFVERRRFVDEHFNTLTQPVGHGFTAGNQVQGTAHYTVRPVADVPLRLIILDTVTPAPMPGWPHFYGVMPRDQFDGFLKPALAAARSAGEYVIIASHHPSADFNLPHPGNTVRQREFRRFLASQPHVIAHICGHTHRHHIETVPGRYPYPEIETGSLIDSPQEGRILALYRDAQSGRFRLDASLVSHRDVDAPLAAESARRAEIDAQYRGESLVKGGWLPGSSAPVQRHYTATERHGQPADRTFSITLAR